MRRRLPGEAGARRRVSSSVSSHAGQRRRARPSPGGNGELWTERQARRSGGTEERGHCEGRHCWAGGRHPRASPFYGFLRKARVCFARGLDSDRKLPSYWLEEPENRVGKRGENPTQRRDTEGEPQFPLVNPARISDRPLKYACAGQMPRGSNKKLNSYPNELKMTSTQKPEQRYL